MIGLFDVNEKVVQVKNKDFLSQHSLFFSHGSFSGISIFPQIAFLLARFPFLFLAGLLHICFGVWFGNVPLFLLTSPLIEARVSIRHPIFHFSVKHTQ